MNSHSRDTPLKQRNAAKVYREAAKQGAEGAIDGACVWIAWAQDKDGGAYFCDPLVEEYSGLFKPGPGVYWGELWADNIHNPRPDPATRECRVLALCFMAAIVEAGDA